jgi:hypothetical protein
MSKSSLESSLESILDMVNFIFIFNKTYYNFIVQQFDFHLPSLTVFETLKFHANIRLNSSFSLKQKLDKVFLVVNTLGLQGCLNTRVGGDEVKGIRIFTNIICITY